MRICIKHFMEHIKGYGPYTDWNFIHPSGQCEYQEPGVGLWGPFPCKERSIVEISLKTGRPLIRQSSGTTVPD